jgi:hypothetical protein
VFLFQGPTRGAILLCKHPSIHFLASGPIFKPSLVVVPSVFASESSKTKSENHWQFQRQCRLHLLWHPPLPLQPHDLRTVINVAFATDKCRGPFSATIVGKEKHVRETYNRDCERDKANTVKETRLKFAAINPDQWEKIDVGLALSVFHQDTISEQALHVATGLGRLDAFLEWLRVRRRTAAFDSTFDSNFVALYRDQVEFLKNQVPEHPLRDCQWKSKLNTLEYCVSSATLFNKLFMNKGKKITRRNLENVRLHVDEDRG